MSTLPIALRDSATMFRRDVRHSLRNPMITLSGILVPILMLVLFNYVFGGAIGAGLGGATHGKSYINYLAPGIIIMTVGSGSATTAINLVTDLSEGIIARFRTMAIFRASVLAGQVFGSLIRTLITVGFVTLVAVLMGFRPTTNPLAWLAALGMIVLFTLAITWMGVVFGLIGQTPAGANSLTLVFQLLAFTSSAFVSPDLMPAGFRWFAQFQPFTPIIDTVRGLLLGTPIGDNNAVLAIAWSVGLTLLGFLWAQAIFNRSSVR